MSISSSELELELGAGTAQSWKLALRLIPGVLFLPHLPDVDVDASTLPERLKETLSATYAFERELGGGGMSRVFVAVEKRYDRRVVVKVLAQELAAGVSAERFEREVALAARLQQANIVPVFDSGEIEGLPYYTMPWVEGESLRARLDARGALPIAESVAIIADVAKALSYAHAHGVVHRDIKPENVLLSGHTAVVTDFGIAKAITASRTVAPFETLTQVGTSLGTPAYMAPEQAMGDPATDHRADLYALGVVAYELLAGERPFTGTSLHELVRAHVTQAPPELASRRREIPAALAALVMRCLDKEPERRPQSADELLTALERVHDSPTTSAIAPSGGAPERRASRRVVAATAVAVLLALAAAGSLWWRRAPAAVATLDPGRVLVAAPVPVDPTARDAAAMTQTALTRALGDMQFVRFADPTVAGDATGDADAAATRAARAAQAGTVVTTTVFPLGSDSIRIETRVLNANSGDLVRAVPPIRVARTASDSAWTVALDPLLSTMAISAFPWLGPSAIPLGAPPRYASVRELLISLSTAVRPDSESRTNTLLHGSRAVGLDTMFLQAQLWRAAILSQQGGAGYNVIARSLLDSAIATVGPRRERLNPFEGVLYEFVVAARRGDQGAALAAQRRMQEIVPGAPVARDLPYRLLDVNRPREAIALLEHERPTRDVDGKLMQPSEDPRHWMALADAYHFLGDYGADREAAAQVRRVRPDAVTSLRYQLGAAAALGDSAAVESLLAEARTLPSRANSNEFFGDIALQVSQELEAHGHPAFAQSVLRRAMEWFESRRPDERPWRVQFRHAIALYVMGKYAAARDSLRPVAATIGDTNSLALGLAGRIAAASGDTAETRRIDARLAELGSNLLGANTLERSFMAAVRGRKDDAVALLQEAFAQGLGFSLRWRLHWFTDVKQLRGYPPFERLIEPQG
ncbi:MAG TPA: serine/threonine-protein kinase [Gemmatimonadaceae bacterium]|nr:serine/threonine-protein kinase [Gemmatimonadaceae bacterium]